MKIGLIEVIIMVSPALIIMLTSFIAIKYWGKTEKEKKHHS